jgi:nucleoside-diphosphate-sugar epimerase
VNPSAKGKRHIQTAIRVLADFAIVQISVFLALGITALLSPDATPDVSAVSLVILLRTYYTATFLPLSLVFPVVFAISGLYTKSRGYSLEHKWRTVIQTSVNATLVYLFLSFLITRSGTLPRSALLAFCLLVSLGIPGVRWLKSLLMDGEVKSIAAPHARTSSEPLVLVVGGAGYIGSILVRKLLAQGSKVRVLDSLVYGPNAIREVLNHPNLELIVGDCRNIQSAVAALRGVDSVVHLGAIVGDPACDQHKQAAVEINYAATKMLIEIAKGFSVRQFVFASSCSVYGSSDVLMNENSRTAPISLYGQTKVDSEQALLEARSESFHPVILRFATVFGNSHRPRFDLVVNLLAAKAHKEGAITVFNGQQWRPFIHVDDVAEGIVTVLKAREDLVSGQIFNLGDSRLNYTLAGVADKIVEQFPHTRVEQVENAEDCRNYRVSFDKIKNQLGFKARLLLEDGISELKNALDEGTISDYRDTAYNNQLFLRDTGLMALKNAIDREMMTSLAGANLAPESVRQTG